jgi:hypothetical protein
MNRVHSIGYGFAIMVIISVAAKIGKSWACDDSIGCPIWLCTPFFGLADGLFHTSLLIGWRRTP